MNRRQKLVQQQFLNDEEISVLDSSIAHLQKVYSGVGEKGGLDGLAFEYFNSMGAGQAKHYANNPEEARELLRSAIQSKVYQKNYQQALQKQVGGILDKMHTQQFKTVTDYLETCYENGFIGGKQLTDKGTKSPLAFLQRRTVVKNVIVGIVFHPVVGLIAVVMRRDLAAADQKRDAGPCDL